MKIKLGFFVLGLFLFLLPFLVFAGDISQIIFTNELQTVDINEAARLTIQVQYAGDSHPSLCMEMFSTSDSGQFSSSDTSWKSVDRLTINSNWTNRNFYYKDSAVGNYDLTVKIVSVSCSALEDQEPEWIISQDIIVSNLNGNENEEQTEQEFPIQPSGGGGNTSYIPPEQLPKIKAYAGKDKIMIAGALGEFRGEAFGFNDEPLENARYLWNFGDGTVKEGQNIFHFYRYLGGYKVVLDVSSGKYASSDAMAVTVVSNEIFISEIKAGNDSFVEIENKSNREINISGWQLRLNRQSFIFPKDSFIEEKNYLVIPYSSSGVLIYQGKGTVELLYPGSFIADSFDYNGLLAEGQSFSRDGENSAITPETPGRKNELPISVVSPVQPVRAEEARSADESVFTSAEEALSQDENLGGEDSGKEANVIAAVGSSNKAGESKKLIYFLAVLGLAAASSLSIFFIRRHREV